MKKTFTLVLTLFIYQLALYGQVGIGTTYPRGALDINNEEGINTQPFVLPTNESASNMKNPLGEEIAPGSMMYDSKEECIRFYIASSHNWTECIKGGSSSDNKVSVTVDCTKNGFEGSYIENEELTEDNKFTVELSNNSFSNATISLKSEDLTLTGTDPDTGMEITDTGLTVTKVSPETVTLNSGETEQITYTLSGTPTKNFMLKGAWKKLSLSCSGTVAITKGMAVFDFSNAKAVVASIITKTPPEIDLQGVIDNETHKISINIPYSEGKGVYSAYTSEPVKVKGEGGETNTLTLSFPEGNFSDTGTITATVKVGGKGTFNVKKLDIGIMELIADLPVKINGVEKGKLNITAVGGILDRSFGDGMHDFVYVPVVGEDGRTWLNHDLGANYTNIHNPAFNPGQRPKSVDDYNAFGSLFQWGRLADTHEIIKYDESGATPLRGVIESSYNTDIPDTDKFIHQFGFNTGYDWRIPHNTHLWQGVNGINNPCPSGYRLPTIDEIKNYIKKTKITEDSKAHMMILGFTSHFYRPYGNDELTSGNILYYTSNIGKYADYNYSHVAGLKNNSIYNVSVPRTSGYPVRCIKD